MKLRELITAKNIQAKQVGKAIGVDASMMSRFVNYKCLPTPFTMDKLTKILECGIEDIYEPHEVYYKASIKSAKRKRKTNVYRLTAELPEEAREFLNSGALQECGFKDITDWVNWCYKDILKKYVAIKGKDLTVASRQVRSKDDKDTRVIYH